MPMNFLGGLCREKTLKRIFPLDPDGAIRPSVRAEA
jgi:hypothetical protein